MLCKYIIIKEATIIELHLKFIGYGFLIGAFPVGRAIRTRFPIAIGRAQTNATTPNAPRALIANHPQQ
jgi:hypothetical protein